MTTMGDTTNNPNPSNAKLWANLSLASPALLSANAISQHADLIAAVWSQRDVVASRKRIYSTTYTQSSPSKTPHYIASPPVELPSAESAASYYSPSRKRFLRFTSSSSTSLLAEVWNTDAGLERVWKIKDTVHGPVYTDEWFGSVSWSPDETMVVYVADRPAPEDPKSKSEDDEQAWIDPLKHTFHEDSRDPLGEGYKSRRSPALFIADLSAGRSVLASAPTLEKSHHFLFGEPQWSPNGDVIVATMRHPLLLDLDDDPEHIRHRPYELGLRYCYNRYAAIVAFDAPGSALDIHSMHSSMKVLSNHDDLEDFCCASPRFSLDGTNLVYVSAPRSCKQRSEGKVLPHNTTKVLRTLHISDGKFSSPSTLIAIPEDPAPEQFPGLYLHGLVQNPWLDADTLAFSSMWGSVQRVMSVSFSRVNGGFAPKDNGLELVDWNTIASRLSEAESGSDMLDANMNLMCVSGNAMILSASTPVRPSQLLCLRYNDAKGWDTSLSYVSMPSERTRNLQKLARAVCVEDVILNERKIVERFDRERDGERLSDRFQVTVMLPEREEGLSPLIVYPHGGPHVATPNGYSVGSAAFLSRGFAVMYINYRGSLGLGQKSLETLPGNVGSQDVDEVIESTLWALRQEEFGLDKERVGFLGGSHSGFLGAHTSLYPGVFKRTVLRNAVTNIATMFGATDIPDWCYCESGLSQKNENGVTLSPDAEQMKEMYIRSPVSRVGNVEYWKSKVGAEGLDFKPGPTFLQVGGSDRRVPPQQSLEWKRSITEAYGSDIVRIRWYPESGHAIDEVPNGDDAWVHALDFLCEI